MKRRNRSPGTRRGKTSREARTGAGTSGVVAALDLGSNSFHMIVAQMMDGRLHVLDRLQEMVRLGGGLDAHGRLGSAARARALACLARFGQRLRGFGHGSVRAVGTNTLRRMHRSGVFLAAAERALGHPIEIIAGREEARLIYQGMAHSWPDDGNPRLVVDVGGGSTEIIIGQGFDAITMESLYMGCVSMTDAYLGDGVITERTMSRAETAARLELNPVQSQFRRGWETAIGTSGTIRSVRSVLRAHGWTDGTITPAALRRLRAALIAARHVDRLRLPGLGADRAPVFAGGVAILTAVHESLGIRRMQVAEGALREGLLYELAGRLRHEDVRERTVAMLARRFHVDADQAARVGRTAGEEFAQVAHTWGLSGDDERLLSWAARLHEIGLAVAHSQYHKHGAYLAEKSDLPGFSWQTQQQLAAIIRGHRRKFPVDVFDALPAQNRSAASYLCVLLRLAVLLHRPRTGNVPKGLKLRAEKRSLQVKFARGWLRQHPLTAADLEQESAWLRAAGINLEFG